MKYCFYTHTHIFAEIESLHVDHVIPASKYQYTYLETIGLSNTVSTHEFNCSIILYCVNSSCGFSSKCKSKQKQRKILLFFFRCSSTVQFENGQCSIYFISMQDIYTLKGEVLHKKKLDF